MGKEKFEDKCFWTFFQKGSQKLLYLLTKHNKQLALFDLSSGTWEKIRNLARKVYIPNFYQI